MTAGDSSVTDYARNLQQAILLDAEVEGAEQMRSEVFTRHLIDVLTEAGELEDAIPCHLRDRGIEVHGYGIDDGDTLNLISTIYRGDVPPATVPPSEIHTAARRLLAFWERCREHQYHEHLEESSDAYDMALHVSQRAADIRRIRLFLGTDGRTSVERIDQNGPVEVEVRPSIWDIVRLHRLETSGQPREPIAIDFVTRFGYALPCLSASRAAADYDAVLAVIPGDWLADIYHEYGARLLELNVRSFLQATGKVNRGIRDTLRDEPSRFLAYNNGISATASELSIVALSDGGEGIASVRDLQIVNGGQTTASMERAKTSGTDLSAVAVQAKITIVPPARLEDIVPLISRYANSQNKVSEADLSANDPFHVELETLSRTIWAPTAGDAVRQTRWFYERARGQYRDALSREGTPARQRAWKASHPTSQRFTKTDVAKFENTWAQMPHEVSRGAQKNFTVFMKNLASTQARPTADYFQRLIGKAILWKRAERLISEQHFGGYRANLVAYSISKLSHATAQRIDLRGIWERQATDTDLDLALVELSHLAWRILVDEAPPGANITEWAKQEKCWRALRDATWSVPDVVRASLVVLYAEGSETTELQEYDDPAVAECAAVDPDTWLGIANWAKETGNLQPWHRKLAYDIGLRMKRGRPPSVKQAQYGRQILDEARRLGYDV